MTDPNEWFSDPGILLTGLRHAGTHWANLPEIPGYDQLVEIRRGGQGVVYRARQISTNRLVAIKVLLDGALASEANRSRFRREIELIAALDHPNIVRIYDSGLTAEGHLHNVMEFVDGLPVDEACEEHGYDLERTLSLFTTICDAVNHAHRHGIIHRDLKPGNILIDLEGEPHVLDFGLAKIIPDLRGDSRARSTVSRTGQFLGSLAWASPEQIEESPDRVDLRTDVYSLGVILYQLITGQLPHAVSNNLRQTVNEITGAPPPAPRSVRPNIPDDVETIVLRCLAKEPERRYPTVGDLGRDIRHYLSGEPIDAKRDRTGYVIRRALARHKTVTALAALVLLLVVGFAVTMTVLYRRASTAEKAARENLDRAMTQTAKAEAVREFLKDMLASSDPLISPDRSMTVRQMLDAASHKIDGRFGEHPAVEAEIRAVIGSAYYSLGHLDEAEACDRRRLALLRELHGEDHVEVARAVRDLGVVMTDRRRFDRAETLLEKALSVTRAHLGEDHVQIADCLLSLAELRQAQFRFEEADARYARACAIYQKQIGLDDPRSLTALVQWSSLLLIRGRLADAEEKLNGALRVLRKHPESNEALLSGVLLSLGMVKYNLKDYASAEAALTEAIRYHRHVYGTEHPRLATFFNYMGHVRRDQRRYHEAEDWYRKALEVCEKTVGRDSVNGASALWNLAQMRWSQGDHDGAESLFREAITIRRRVFDADHHLVQASLSRFAQLLGEAGQWRKALPILEKVVRTRTARYGENHVLAARSRARLGECLAELDRFEESEALLRSAHAVLAAGKKVRRAYLTHVLTSLVRLYTRWGKPDQANRYRALLDGKD